MKSEIESMPMKSSNKNSQDVPSGYKRTEIGVIPKDWEVLPIKKCVKNIISGGTPSTNVSKYWVGDIPWITGVDIVEQKLTNIRRYICNEAIINSSTNIVGKNNLLVVTRTGVGKIAIAPFRVAISQDLTGLECIPEEINTYFLFHWLNFSMYSITKLTQGTSINGVTKDVLIEHLVPKPGLKEQKAIAKVLSDVDSLIDSLDKLIHKKKAIKKAAMQQLLTGETRLPGFTEPWETRRLKDILTYERPEKFIVKDTEYQESGTVPVLTANQSFVLGYTYEKFGIYKDIPVIIFDDFTTESKWVNKPFKIKSSAIKILKSKTKSISLRYIFERIQLINFSLGDHKRYYISEYQNIEIEIPNYKEQKAIAKVLSDMDDEIEALEKRKEKTEQIKQSMMQQLLTGKIRLLTLEENQ